MDKHDVGWLPVMAGRDGPPIGTADKDDLIKAVHQRKDEHQPIGTAKQTDVAEEIPARKVEDIVSGSHRVGAWTD